MKVHPDLVIIANDTTEYLGSDEISWGQIFSYQNYYFIWKSHLPIPPVFPGNNSHFKMRFGLIIMSEIIADKFEFCLHKVPKYRHVTKGDLFNSDNLMSQ